MGCLRKCGWVGALALIVAGLVPISPAAGADRVSGTESTRNVTLVTGDTVAVADGPAVRRITPAKGRERMRFTTMRLGGDLFVVPNDAGPLLASGRLDERLFNVSQLLEWGYDDSGRTTIPLLADRATTGARTSIAGATVTSSFRASGLDLLRVEKRSASTFWKSLADGSSARTLGDGIGKLWLDGRRRASLDRSVPQIGAPTAWRKGLTGKGITVAVLDTGIDAKHPDLRDAVAASKGFTDAGAADTEDLNGHGTHVASIVTGSGAASSGTLRGVASGAQLAVGKVLNDSGWGEDSWIIAGMEWAATEVEARVVNMSLGAPDTQGSDPLEQAVDRLTDRTGTLFVVAAGNEGALGERSIASPGSARAALTVGAIDDRERLAAFSSRGPRTGDAAVKPDLTAPGVDINAAFPGGGYERLSGTSMAAPHVAGAAAILAQQHPTWRAAELKGALIGTATPRPELSAFEQGGGRVDLANAVNQPVVAVPGNLSAYLASPHASEQTHTITFTNTTGRPTTLGLSTRATRQGGGPAPSGLFRLSATSVVVPPNGSAQVRVSVRPVRPGVYSGTLTAAGPGGRPLRVLLGAYVEPPARQVTVKAIDRLGRPVAALLVVHSDRTPFREFLWTSNGVARARLPLGTYSVFGLIQTVMPREPYPLTLVNTPVTLAGSDPTVVIDTRKAKVPTMRLDEPTAQSDDSHSFGIVYGRGRAEYSLVDHFTASQTSVLAAKQKGLRYFALRTWFKRGSLDPTPSPYRYDVVDYRRDEIPADPSFSATTKSLARVTTTYRSQDPGSQGASQTFLVLPDGSSTDLSADHPMPLPNTVEEYVTADPELRWRRQVAVDVPELSFGVLDGRPRSYPRGHHHEVWNAAALGPAMAPTCGTSRVTGSSVPCATRDADEILYLGQYVFFSETGDRSRFSFLSGTGTVTLAKGTTVVKSVTAGEVLRVAVPREPALYTLTVAMRRRTSPTGLASRAEARYTFRSGHTVAREGLPLMAVRFAPRGLDDHNLAAPGSVSHVPLWIERNPGSKAARIRSLSVQVSRDDGKTWQTARATKNRGGWSLRIENPDAGYISLRATAIDSSGASVTQTVIRAYGVRP